jgi:hypothetical protein
MTLLVFASHVATQGKCQATFTRLGCFKRFVHGPQVIANSRVAVLANHLLYPIVIKPVVTKQSEAMHESNSGMWSAGFFQK